MLFFLGPCLLGCYFDSVGHLTGDLQAPPVWWLGGAELTAVGVVGAVSAVGVDCGVAVAVAVAAVVVVAVVIIAVISVVVAAAAASEWW